MTATAQPPALEAERLALSYGTSLALDATDLSIPRGQVVAVLGPSGCGKTTLLNLVAGLLRPTRGLLRLNGTLVARAGGVFVPPERRALGMVFQDYALWPHMTIGRNVAFPLEMRGVARPERERRVTEALARVGLAGFEGRAPSQLSGGQQQRAAVARALVAEPNLILFDEPLSNLDRALRETLSQDLSSLLRASALTAVYVTHDHEEAFTLADRVILMRKGAIVQDASPGLVTREPADPDAARFLRLGAVLHAERRGGAWTAPGFPHPIKPTRDMNGARSAHVLIPNGAAALTSPSRHVGLASVIRSSYGPEGFIATIRLDGADADMTIRAGGSGRPAPGERVGVAIDESALHWFEPARTRGAEGEARAD